MNLPGYSPDFNADEAIWGWAREEATGNRCLGTKSAVQQRVSAFLADLSSCRLPGSLPRLFTRTLTHPGNAVIFSNIRLRVAGQSPPSRPAPSSARCGESRSR